MDIKEEHFFSFDYDISNTNDTREASCNYTNTENSLTYGEMRMRDVSKVLNLLNTENTKICYDVGMGAGKISLQAFQEYRELTLLVGM